MLLSFFRRRNLGQTFGLLLFCWVLKLAPSAFRNLLSLALLLASLVILPLLKDIVKLLGLALYVLEAVLFS